MRISVALAYYNGGKYIEEQLNSILEQLGEEDEVVLSVDSAEDGSMSYLREKAKADRRIHLAEGPGKGVIANFENAIRCCQGEYIFLADQDDIWMSQKVSEILKVFRKTDYMAVLHNGVLMDGQGDVMDGPSLFSMRHSGTGLMKNLMKNSYIGCCMAFRRELVDVILPIPKHMYMHDYWIGTAAERYGGVCLISKPLIRYRRHEGNVTEMHHGSVWSMLKKRAGMIYCLLILRNRLRSKRR